MKAATLKNWRPITWQCKVKHHASLLCGRGSYLDGCDLKTWTTLLRCGNGKKRWQIGKFYRISGFLKKDLTFFEQDTRTGYKSNLEKDIKGYVHVFVCILNKKKSNSVYTMLCMYEFHQFNVILLPNSCMKDHYWECCVMRTKTQCSARWKWFSWANIVHVNTVPFHQRRFVSVPYSMMNTTIILRLLQKWWNYT